MSDISRFTDSIRSVDFDSFSSEPDRRLALHEARALVRRLEKPMETVIDLFIYTPGIATALTVAHDLDMYNKLSAENGRAKTTSELAGPNASVKLVARMLRQLAASNFVTQTAPHAWTPTRHTQALRSEGVFSIVEISNTLGLWAFNQTKYLRKVGFAEPDDLRRCAYFDVHGETFFESMQKSPEVSRTFGTFMSAYGSQRMPWVDAYPTHELVRGAKKDGPVLVDMGGSTGHDAGKLVLKEPSTAGKVWVQDQAHVIEQSRGVLPPGVNALGHDFFTPQPVRGARAYFMRSTLHDWPDADAHRILTTLRPALTKDYSKLLICDIVIPPTGANSYQTGADLLMSAGAGAKERTQDEWKALLEGAGYRITRVLRDAAMEESIVEAEVA